MKKHYNTIKYEYIFLRNKKIEEIKLIILEIFCNGTTGKLVEVILIEKCRENDTVPPTVT